MTAVKDKVAAIAAHSKSFQDEIVQIVSLPLEVQQAHYDYVLHRKIFENTRGYIIQVVDQINRCYEQTCYDACAVMIRRLIEILIIETYDSYKVESEICDSDGNFFFLEELINRFTSASHWKIGRNTKAGLKKLKTIGDQSAHSRRYNAKRSYIDDIAQEFRIVAEELLYLSGLRK